MKNIIIVGGGPGGLTAGMLLGIKNYKVKIFEKKDKIGGRNSRLELNGYNFDMGPTFFLMKHILEEIFFEVGKNLDDYVETMEINPMYRLKFPNFEFYPYSYSEMDKMLDSLDKTFPGSVDGYLKFIEKEKIKFRMLEPCLKKPYLSLGDYINKKFIKALPYVDIFKSLYEVMGKYFKDENLKLSFTFQAKYIGMSPWVAPGVFSMISYLEHRYGIYHVKGGLNRLSHGMGEVFKELGGEINLNSEVENIIFQGKKAIGVKLKNGKEYYGDKIIINADFAYSMKNLVNKNIRDKYSDINLYNKKYSCSTYMIYLGLDKIYENIPHHNIIFAKDYKRNLKLINNHQEIEEDFSFYIQNPSVIDNTLAPEGHSSIYILVPVSNNKSKETWSKKREKFYEKIIDILEEKGGFINIRNHIKEKKVITPSDWEYEENVYLGATFNLAHNLGQMLSFRPHNRLEGYENLYIVGGGTHPGSGLPTIYESGRIVANLIEKGE
ncbi:phytoene desaturase family protein [Cetobacterium ceti]